MIKEKELISIIDTPRTNNQIDLIDSCGKRLSIISDVMYETMINNEKNKKYPAYLLSLILNKAYNYLYDNMRIEKNKLDKDNVNDKGRTTDFICEFDDNLTIIEMNNCSTPETMLRNYSYMNQAVANKTSRGSKYRFPNAILINLNNFSYKGRKETKEEIYLKTDHNEIYTDRIRIINIYIPNIREKWYNDDELSELEKALLVMTDNKEEFTDLMKGNEFMEDYIDDANDASEDNYILGLYNKEVEMEKLKRIQYESDLKQEVEEKVADAVTEQAKEIANSLLDKGISIDIIASSTGLSKEEIQELQN